VKKDLNDINVDLSEVLMKKKSDDNTKKKNNNIPIVQVVNTKKKKTGNESRDATLQRKTQRESRAWGRSDRYAQKPMASSTRSAEEESALLEEEQEAQAKYDDLKKELYLWTIGLTAFCFGSTVVFYGRDVGASYGVGALGGFLYLRSLSRSMDSFGTGFGSVGSPRLLIPVILALGYNRYNTLVAESSGLHLELLPMLVGFFTYKGALVAKQGLELLDDVFNRNKGDV
jgi:ATP synthase protein I